MVQENRNKKLVFLFSDFQFLEPISVFYVSFSLESNATILARRAKNVSLEFYEEIQQIKSG